MSRGQRRQPLLPTKGECTDAFNSDTISGQVGNAGADSREQSITRQIRTDAFIIILRSASWSTEWARKGAEHETGGDRENESMGGL